MSELIKIIKIAGVDEAGRGPLAGPVIAGAVILDAGRKIYGLADSKQLTPLQRDKLYDKITTESLAFAVGRAEVAEIEELNIHHATLLAMRRAVEGLPIAPDEVWVDGLHCPQVLMLTRSFVRGDQTIPSISAASIIAKVSRDREMQEYEKLYPGYGFGQHKGYAVKQHFAAIKKLGLSPIHRRSFASLGRLSERLECNE